MTHKQKELLRMNNYSIQLHGLKREISGFCEKISEGLGKPKQKLVKDIVFGVGAAQSCILSEIARALNEEIALKKTIDRLGRELMKFDGIDKLRDNFAQLVKPHLKETPTYLVDLSDLAKPYGKTFEGLAKVRDGSTKEIVPGKLSNAIAKAYLLRWRVEENFRFKKMQFEMEGFRVRKLTAIRALHRIVTILVGFTALLSEQREDFALPQQLVTASKRIFPPKLRQSLRAFFQYAIADGIAALLRRTYLPLARTKPRAFGCSAQIALRGF